MSGPTVISSTPLSLIPSRAPPTWPGSLTRTRTLTLALSSISGIFEDFPAFPDFSRFQRPGAPGNARHIRLFPAISGRMMRPEIRKRSGSLGSVGFVSAKRHPLRSERGASRTVAHHSGPSDGGGRGYLPRRAERAVGRRPVDFATQSGPRSGMHFRAQPSRAREGAKSFSSTALCPEMDSRVGVLQRAGGPGF